MRHWGPLLELSSEVFGHSCGVGFGSDNAIDLLKNFFGWFNVKNGLHVALGVEAADIPEGAEGFKPALGIDRSWTTRILPIDSAWMVKMPFGMPHGPTFVPSNEKQDRSIDETYAEDID